MLVEDQQQHRQLVCITYCIIECIRMTNDVKWWALGNSLYPEQWSIGQCS